MAFEKTVVAARGRWRGILVQLGLDPKFLDGLHGPCPICGGHDRFRFDDHEGNGTWWCNVCGPGAGMGLVMRFLNLPFPEAAKRVDGVMGLVQVNDPRVVEQTVEKKRDTMRDMFRESRPVQAGDPVHAYLTRRCGDPAGALEDLRFHPALWHKEAAARFPAMLAFMGWDPVLRKFSGIHRTYLTADGQKAPVWPVRKNFGTAGPVRLGPVAPRMGIAEGIETALCGSKLFGLPVWSGICAHGVETWSPPAGVEGVLILGDNDENYVGQAAANDLAKRLRALGLVVEVRLPPVLGQDWADVWALQQQEVA